MAHIRQSRPEYGAYKTVKARCHTRCLLRARRGHLQAGERERERESERVGNRETERERVREERDGHSESGRVRVRERERDIERERERERVCERVGMIEKERESGG